MKISAQLSASERTEYLVQLGLEAVARWEKILASMPPNAEPPLLRDIMRERLSQAAQVWGEELDGAARAAGVA